MYYLRTEKLVMFARISKDIITSYYRPKVEMEVHMRPRHWNKILGLIGWIEKRISVSKYVEANVVCGLPQ